MPIITREAVERRAFKLFMILRTVVIRGTSQLEMLLASRDYYYNAKSGILALRFFFHLLYNGITPESRLVSIILH